MAMGMAGGVFGQAPLRLAVEATDWRTTNLTLALGGVVIGLSAWLCVRDRWRGEGDRKSTRLNSSHPSISYAVFCLKKKKKIQIVINTYINRLFSPVYLN